MAGHDLYRAWLIDQLAAERGQPFVDERRGLLETELDWLEKEGELLTDEQFRALDGQLPPALELVRSVG